MLTANQITAELLIEIPKRFPGRAWVYRNNRLEADAVGKGGRKRHVSAGLNGQGDLSGIVTVEYGDGLVTPKRRFGLRCEIEVKASYRKGKDRLSASQLSFQHLVTGMGAVYIVARDVEECLKELEGLCGYTSR